LIVWFESDIAMPPSGGIAFQDHRPVHPTEIHPRKLTHQQSANGEVTESYNGGHETPTE
jgi:hypothetical protein